MKKIAISIIISLLLMPLANAATIFSDYANTFGQNLTRDLAPITITAQADGEITAEHGINLLIDPDRYILWNKDLITASGTAVDNGRLPASLTPDYMDGYKVLHIPVISNFMNGEQVVLNGLKLRSYDREIGQRYIGLDYTGDKVQEVQDVNSYRVTTDVHTDQTPPYPVTGLSYTVNEALNAVTLTWSNPPDYDIVSIVVEKQVTRNGVTGANNELFINIFTDTVTDKSDVKEGDEILYTVYAKDRRNKGETATITVAIQPPAPEPAPEPPTPAEPEPEVTPPNIPAPDSDEETADLNRLYFYYKVRYQIKCLKADSSECLWAKINLLYSQEKTGHSDFDISLSARDLYLMALRIKWPEMRYQTKCVDAPVRDKTCNALEKSINRVHYFID